MASKCVIIFALFVSICVIRVNSHPIPNSGSSLAEAKTSTSWNLLLALAFTISCAILVFGCLSCCKQRAGFKEFRNPESNANSVGLDFVNPLQEVINQQPSRYSIFSSFVSSASTSSKQPESVVTFEPLPRVLPNKSNPRLPQFNVYTDGVGVSQDWLGDKDFPRDQLHYLRECGQGWFGKVVEGEARGIVANSNKIHRVFVRILKEDASPSEQAFFLREAKPYRDLNHANVLRLLGRCLENVPFLLVFEACSNGDLKSYLKQNIGNRDALVYQGVILRMAIDIASGLSYMLQHTFVHTDIAARNCLVGADLKVKVGDYGISLQNYKEEYYFNGDIALPIRWCAPETLKCTETTIEPQQVTGASCIWSYGVLLWELEEWAELPYKELSNDEVISRVFGSEGLRLPCPSMRTPFTKEIYEIMKECWKDYVDRPSFIHVINALSALLHRFKNKDFDSRWHLSKPNSIPVTDNDDDKSNRRRLALASKSDNDSGIDLDNPKLSKGLSLQQLQQSSSGSPRHRVMNDEYSSGDSPASSRRYSNSSTADLFSSPVSMKHHRSPSLENLHGSLDNICSGRRGDDVFEYAGGSGSGGGEFSWYPREAYQQRRDSDSSSTVRSGKEQKLNFRLGLVSNTDSDVLWNNHQLFQPDSLIEDNSLTRRIDSLGTDTEDEMWRRRIERGEFTEKVKEKSKSVADLMILTHIDCSESSESDSLPSFHSRQSSFKSTRRGSKSNVVATASSLMNSLSFGSESNLPVVEKDQQFQETLKKIQIAKISGTAGGDLEDSLSYMSLQTSANLPSVASKDGAGGSKGGHFLADEASKKRSSQISSQISRENVAEASGSGADNKLPVVCAAETSDEGAAAAGQKSKSDESNFLVDEARSCARTTEDRVADVNANDSSENANDDEDLSPVNDPTTASISYDVLYSSSSSSSSSSSESCASNDDSDASSSANDLDSVVIGPSESHTLEFFKGLKTTLVDAANAKPSAQEAQPEDSKEPSEDVQYEESPRTLNDFLNECDDYFYKCDEDIRRGPETRFRTQYCDYCFAKCHFSNNECLRCCKDRCLDDNCSCESFDNLEKFRSGDCATLNSCPFQSDDSGRGTDQINSGDGSSDKSLEGSISVQMNEVKNRLEDVIAKFVADDSDDNCSSLEEDKEATQVVNEIIEIEELPDDQTVDNELECSVKIEEPMEDENGAISRRGSSFATSEEYEVSLSVDEDTCVKLQSQVSEDSGNCPSVLDSKSATASDSPTTDSGNFVKVEQLFFSVDPKLEKEMEQLKSSTENNIDQENSDLQQRRSFSPDEIEENVDDEQHPKEAYEISDILEGLCEPISLPYSINEEDDGEGDEDSSESSWLPSPIDDDYRRRLDMDEKFVELIRNELLEKLPNTSSSTLAIVEPQEEASSDENPRITIEYNTYPSQLSPILEEEEEEYSSLSSIRSMCSSDEDVDVDGGGDGSDSDSEDCSTSKKYFLPEDDVLIVNTLTNEASIVDKSDSKSATLASFLKPKLNETYEIEENEDDTIEIADNLDSDSVPTPDSLSPGTSSKTGAHLSYSSSESGNLSDVFLSPSSSKNFDEFDEKSSSCDTRHLNTPENTLLYPSSSNKNDYQKAITNIDELLKNSREFRDNSAAATAAINEFIDPVQCVRDDSWIKSFFLPYHDTCSLVEFNSMSDISESECKSLPADFKSENWPPMDELCDSNDRTPTNEQEKPIAVEPYDSADTTIDVDQIDSTDPKSETHRENDEAGIHSSNNFDSTRTKVKNSLALFGNTSKQIRNFHVSLVKDDNYAFVSKTSPTSPKNIVDSYVANSNQSSEKTWKPPLNAFLNSQNLDNFGLKEINVNDLMSTSFIECGSQDGSIDQDDIKSDTESEDGEEQCTNDEFEWKKTNEDDNANEEKFHHDSEDENGNDVDDNDDDDDDEDDEELADFVPYSWNIGAVPQKSALKNEEKIKGVKKNVSFKKQKYHCVYEYPKDETNYVRTYDEILQDRMLGLWSLDRDNLYADYSSFSDWELDDCEESQTCSDDLMPYPGLPTTVTSKGNSVSTKLGFYTIGAYDLDASIKLTSAIEDNPSTYYLSSPGSSSVPSPTTTTSSSSSIPLSNDTRNEETTISEKCNPFKELNLNAKGIENGSKVGDDYVDLPSPGLGELKHTKNRLKLDLSGNASARNEDKRSTTTITNAKEEPDENVNDEDAENNAFNYGLNFKSCDISPVVELPKSLTSASVA
ncbi:uncharacterized protein LOC135844477 isoform X2 [Planococcus citri]|uniref:uncharacterized protein LOC135844477 isoform X2 n=1 Tax=Planococcus citri TaxID=170843 RepID=UPI0031F8B996